MVVDRRWGLRGREGLGGEKEGLVAEVGENTLLFFFFVFGAGADRDDVERDEDGTQDFRDLHCRQTLVNAKICLCCSQNFRLCWSSQSAGGFVYMRPKKKEIEKERG